jgi:Sigma-70 region 2
MTGPRRDGDPARRPAVERCVGCQGLGVAVPRSRYCEACRRRRCGECHHYAGHHSPTCQYLRRTRRPRLTQRVDRVPLIELLALFINHRALAVRIARSIVGDALAEDCASEVSLYLLERRVYLRRSPSPAYFYTAVRHSALRVLRSSWHRTVVAMDPDDLLAAEQAMVAGKTSDHTVRLPEPAA